MAPKASSRKVPATPAAPAPSTRTGGRGIATADTGTRERIMHAAAELFAAKGLHGPTAREIARAAGVHPNLVGYHFESTEALYNAVMDEVTDGILAERVTMLSDLDVRYAPASPPVSEIVLTIVRPWMGSLAKDADSFRQHVRLAAREGGTRVWAEFIERKLAPTIRQQIAMLHRAIPNASREDVVMLVQLTYAAITMVAEYAPHSQLDHELSVKGTPQEIETRIVKVMTAAALALA